MAGVVAHSNAGESLAVPEGRAGRGSALLKTDETSFMDDATCAEQCKYRTCEREGAVGQLRFAQQLERKNRALFTDSD